jgi:hypothetical protein
VLKGLLKELRDKDIDVDAAVRHVEAGDAIAG